MPGKELGFILRIRRLVTWSDAQQRKINPAALSGWIVRASVEGVRLP